MPVAVLAGNYQKEMYSYYLTIRVINKNWGSESPDWSEDARTGLSFLGLSFDMSYSTTWDNFLKIVKAAIDEGYPVVVPVSYHKLFYYLAVDDECPHILMISGYDDERKLLFIVDCNMVEHGLSLYSKEYTLYQLPLTYNIFREIWEGSHEFFKRKSIPFYGKSFTVKKQSCVKENIDIKHVLTKSFIPDDSAIVKFIGSLTETTTYEDVDFIYIRRVALRQLVVLFDTVDSIISSEELCLAWKNARKETLHLREKVLNRLELVLLKGRSISKEYLTQIKRDIARSEEEVHSLIEKI